jgi:uncharacterized protein YggU (UPF0235/DUF167 family)
VVARAAPARPGIVPLSALRVRLTPGGAADRIEGRARDAEGQTYLQARVRAVPENNEANRALEVLIAKSYGVAKSKVRVTRGQTGRLKTVEIEGASEADIAAFLAKFGEKP